jgi:tripartite-type tricarboxylate transporter receptor subunit TctC
VREKKKDRRFAMRRKRWIIIIVLGLSILPFQGPGSALAKDPDYPTKPITFYIPYGTGGTADISGRAFVGAASRYIGQPFIPVNKPGGGGSITGVAVMNAKPDGYTLGMAVGSNVFVAPFSGDAPYKDMSGFTMIANFGNNVYPWIVRMDAPWKTWKEFIDWARKNPKAAKIGITGARSTTTQGLAMWQIENREQVKFTHIPFKSSAEILTALLGGHISMFSTTIDASTVPYLKEGKLRILAYSSSHKLSGYEDAPSTRELYGFSNPNVFGVCGPKGLPEVVLRRLDDAFVKAIKDPEFVNAMDKMFFPVYYMDKSQMTQYVAETFPKVGEIMKQLKAEEAKERK